MATTTKTKRARAPKTVQGELLRLDLGAGQRVTEGFEGVDLKSCAGIKHVVDLFKPNWPFKDNSVGEVVSNHVVEHIPHYRPEYAGLDGWWVFFNELHRICADGAPVTITHPYAKHDRGMWDPTHTRYINEVTWYYLDRSWREAQGLDHYDAQCDFKVVNISATGVSDDYQNRTPEMQERLRTHEWNHVPDLHVLLKASK